MKLYVKCVMFDKTEHYKNYPKNIIVKKLYVKCVMLNISMGQKITFNI